MLDTDLDAAVREGIITPQQGAALRELAQSRGRQRAIEIGHEERFRFMRGFNDVLLSIGVVLLVGGFAYIMPRSAFGYAVTAAMAWALAELLVARLKLVLAGILLAGAFVVLVYAASVQLPLGSWLATRTPNTEAMICTCPESVKLMILRLLHFNPYVPLAFTARALIAAGAAFVFYWRFGLPFALLPLAASLVGAVMGAASLLFLDPPAASFLLPEIAAVPYAIVVLLCGLGVFAAAMIFDASDRERLTRRADCAFWLHLLAAPLIVHSLIGLVASGLAGSARYTGTAFSPGMTSELAAAIVLIVALLAVVAILIDRRALLVSGLAYLGGAIAYALAGAATGPSGSNPSVVIAASLVILGAFVLTLGAAWVPLRRRLLALLLPAAIADRLPPVPARP
jgi:hypothetical protein